MNVFELTGDDLRVWYSKAQSEELLRKHREQVKKTESMMRAKITEVFGTELPNE